MKEGLRASETSVGTAVRPMGRRRFLLAGIAAAMSGLGNVVSEDADRRSVEVCPSAKRRQSFVALQYAHLLGRPSSWQAVEDGFFPIPPERMVILGPTNRQGRIRFGEPVDHEDPPLVFNGQFNDGRGRCERIAQNLATYYGLPEQKRHWAELIAMHDPLEPPVSCEGVFLGDLPEGGRSPLVHWWMFVYGDPGTGRDDRQPHFTLVQASSGLESREAGLAGLYLAHMAFRIHVNPRKWECIASMDRLEATRFVNDQMVKALRGLPA